MVAARHTMIAIAAMSDLGGTERRVWGPRPASGTGLTTDGVQPGLSPSAVAVLSPVGAPGTSSASGTAATAGTGSGAGAESTAANTEAAAEEPD